MDAMTERPAAIRAEQHWTGKGADVKLFLFEKCAGDPQAAAATILFGALSLAELAASDKVHPPVPIRPLKKVCLR